MMSETPLSDYDRWKLEFTKRPKVRQCPDCGEQLSRQADYCHFCGWVSEEE